MASLAEISIAFRADLKQFSSEMENAQRSMKKFGNKMKRAGSALSVGITLPVLAIGAASVKSASDAEETSSKYQTIFRDISNAAQTASEELQKSYGQSSRAAQQLLGDTGDLLTGFGFSQQAALDLSTEVNKLAIDLASFTNFSGGAAGASAALTKALLGEREGVKSLGITILEADVKARVLENTQKGLTFETERQAKAFATLQIAQDQSKNAIGDYARTSKSFANQARLLKARIEDLSAEFGEILLPYFTDGINKVNAVVEKFKGLDASTKKIIVVVAGLAAAIGPLLLTIGYMSTTAIPLLITGFAKTRAALIALNAIILANPITALVTAVAAAAAAYLIFSNNTNSATNATKALSDARLQAAKAVGSETALLERLLKIARDESQSKQDRLKAIEAINKISPEYLGNINLENINTQKTTASIESYIGALNKKALAQAIEAKQQEAYNSLIEKNFKAQERLEKRIDDITSRVERRRNAQQSVIAGGGLNASFDASADRKLLEDQAKTEFDAALETNKAAYDEYVTKLKAAISEVPSITDLLNEAGGSGAVLGGGDTSAKEIKLKTVLEFESIGATGINETVDAFEKQLQVLELTRQSYAATTTEYQNLTNAINLVKQNIDEVKAGFTGPLIPEGYGNTDIIDATAEKLERLREVGIAVGNAVGEAFGNLANGFIENLGLVGDGFKGFIGQLISAATKAISVLLSQSIANAILSGSQSAAGSGPAAVFTLPVFIASAVGAIISAFGSIPKFADGGIITGPTLAMVGEYRGASNNPEIIAPLSKLKSMLGDTGGGIFIPDARISGNDIVISYERTKARDNRLK
ncbi:MAG: phage tail tape measure protein [Flavobacteriaceae bacterium CG18_big_fil_WC_8_21_14_2_50_34_36]|nr:phage tail tape measure protein [Flavobacteriia bacterium]PIQ18613.1 MAG: phage tail tape measure protein [Flavobacteriaceae bacterium CG18_big_fil_WC_8_21_14_2_50_34_36]